MMLLYSADLIQLPPLGAVFSIMSIKINIDNERLINGR